jgi:hypothetical protein
VTRALKEKIHFSKIKKLFLGKPATKVAQFWTVLCTICGFQRKSQLPNDWKLILHIQGRGCTGAAQGVHLCDSWHWTSFISAKLQLMPCSSTEITLSLKSYHSDWRASSFTVGNNNNAIIPDEQINACLLYQPWCKLHNPKIHNNNNMWVNLIVMSLMTYETLVIILPQSNYL